jgi:hypothetical protein
MILNQVGHRPSRTFQIDGFDGRLGRPCNTENGGYYRICSGCSRVRGMEVVVVPTVFDPVVSAGPTGRRGLFAYSRAGYEASNPSGFRLVANS